LHTMLSSIVSGLLPWCMLPVSTTVHVEIAVACGLCRGLWSVLLDLVIVLG
jgi:hypothetical protein